MNDFETILYEEQDGIATVTLNRPEVHNAFNIAMQLELQGGLDARCAATTTSGSSC